MDSETTKKRTDAPELSLFLPVLDEEDNLRPMHAKIKAALDALGKTAEVIFVDDGSTDKSLAILKEIAAEDDRVRVISLRRNYGQTAAMSAGIDAARGEILIPMDADLQNDPADIPAMLDLMRQTGADMVQGDRSHARKDNAVRRVGSIVGRTFRLWLLGDSIRDTGCSLRVMKREIALKLPLEFRGMHRFIPVTARHLGYTVVEMRVNHRPRHAGQTKYGMGIVQRALPGLVDLLAVRYMRNRRRATDSAEVTPAAARAGESVRVAPRAREGAAA